MKLLQKRKILQEMIHACWEDCFLLKATHINDMPRGNEYGDLSDKLVRFEERTARLKKELEKIDAQIKAGNAVGRRNERDISQLF